MAAARGEEGNPRARVPGFVGGARRYLGHGGHVPLAWAFFTVRVVFLIKVL